MGKLGVEVDSLVLSSALANTELVLNFLEVGKKMEEEQCGKFLCCKSGSLGCKSTAQLQTDPLQFPKYCYRVLCVTAY